MKIVSDWKRCHKWFSVRLSALGITSSLMWTFLPFLKENISDKLMMKITLGLFILIFLGTFIDQKKRR